MINLYAALLNNELVLATEQAKIVKNSSRLFKKHYLCPHCQQEVQLIVKKQTAYFKHIPLIINQVGEKQEHALSKKLLKKALLAANFAAETEVVLANKQLRADVLAGTDLAFEIQCAPLNRSEFRHRHLLYGQIGITDIWIVGQRHYLQHNIKKSQLIFFRQNKQWHDYYLEIDPFQKIINLKFNVLLEPITNQAHYQVKTFALNGTGIAELWHFLPKFKKYQINPTLQKNYLQMQLKQKSTEGLQVASMLYQNHLTVEDLPSWVFRKFRSVNSCNNAISFLHKT